MPEKDLFHIVSMPFCQVLMLEDWDAEPGRFYVAYHAHGHFTKLLGQGVVDEFRTISGPVFLSPASIMGGIYDAGMRLADARDVEAPIDQGWPPLTIGIEADSPDRPSDWQQQVLSAIQNRESTGTAPWDSQSAEHAAGDYKVSALHSSVEDQKAASVFVTDAPLLPQQLARLAEVGSSDIDVAISTGNRLSRVENAALHQVETVSERQLSDIIRAVGQSL